MTTLRIVKTDISAMFCLGPDDLRQMAMGAVQGHPDIDPDDYEEGETIAHVVFDDAGNVTGVTAR